MLFSIGKVRFSKVIHLFLEYACDLIQIQTKISSIPLDYFSQRDLRHYCTMGRRFSASKIFSNCLSQEWAVNILDHTSETSKSGLAFEQKEVNNMPVWDY